MNEIYNLIQELAWQFGNRGFNGECCADLSLVEYMALTKVNERPNITIQELGNDLGFTKSGTSKMVDRLERKQYVVRDTSPLDGRVCCVNITAQGAKVIGDIVTDNSERVSQMLLGQDAQTLQNIKEALKVLVDSAHRQSRLSCSKT